MIVVSHNVNMESNVLDDSDCSDGSGSVKSFVSSKLPLPETIEYEDLDNETLRKELALRGYNPGPITSTTRRVYLQKLKQLKKLPLPVKNTEGDVAVTRGESLT